MIHKMNFVLGVLLSRFETKIKFVLKSESLLKNIQNLDEQSRVMVHRNYAKCCQHYTNLKFI